MFVEQRHYLLNPHYGTGVFRRRIVRTSAGIHASATLLDDFHDMAVHLAIEGDVITDVAADMARFPKTTCPGAIASLARLQGRPAASLRSAVDHSSQCTHLIDLASLATSWFGKEGVQVIEIALTDRDAEHRQHLDVHVDGQSVLVWELLDEEIVQPQSSRGRKLFGGFGRWVRDSFPPDEADIWQIAQMAVFVARGRAYIVDSAVSHSTSQEPARLGACFSFTGEAFEVGRDRVGYVQDMSSGLPPYRQVDHRNT